MAALEIESAAPGRADGDVELLVQLLKLSSLINGPMLDGVAAPNDLALNELRIALCLGGEGPLAGHDIADIMGLAPMNVSRALASLQQRGWIEAVDDPANRRRKPFRLSKFGWKCHQALLPDLAGVASFLLGKLTPRERTSMLHNATKLTDRMADWLEIHHAGLRVRHSDD